MRASLTDVRDRGQKERSKDGGDMASKDDIKKHRLSVFLIKAEYGKPEDFIAVDGFDTIKVGNPPDEGGYLIYKGGFQSEPSWVSIFKGVPGFKAHLIKNQSSKALYITRQENRWFCFTFGYARHLLDDLSYERNFGLMVALNLGDPAAIKSIDKTNVGYISLHSKEQSTRDVELSNFEFDVDIDLLKSLTAKSVPINGDDAETFSGRDSVTVYTRVALNEFGDICKRLIKAYSSTDYKTRYPWIDKVREERDANVISKLEDAVVSGIVQKDFSKIWLAVPEAVQWEQIDGFAFRRASGESNKPGPVLYQDLSIEEWIKISHVASDLTMDQLRSKKIWVYWQDGRPPTSWNFYRCLNAEVDEGGKKYILNDGDWYSIDPDFVEEVSQFYKSVSDSQLDLPNFGAQTEPKYLQTVAAAHPSYALMDRKVIMIGGGRNRIEFCDLFSSDKQIIHVKKYGGSSLLSHLFSQAIVSGDAFLNDPAFREELNKLLPKPFKVSNPAVRPDPAKYEICMAVMSTIPGPLELPFFSKVSFKYAVRALQKIGYTNITKLKIDM